MYLKLKSNEGQNIVLFVILIKLFFFALKLFSKININFQVIGNKIIQGRSHKTSAKKVCEPNKHEKRICKTHCH